VYRRGGWTGQPARRPLHPLKRTLKMAADMATASAPGKLVKLETAGGTVEAWIPAPLAPLALGHDTRERLERASRALSRLDALHAAVPDPQLLHDMALRREAVASLRLEGSRVSCHALALRDAGLASEVPAPELAGVDDERAALEHGLERLRVGFPLSVRLWRRLHALLLRSRPEDEPGELRWGWPAVSPPPGEPAPPPPEAVGECHGALERYLNGDVAPAPALVRAGLAYAQLEAIAPFAHGTGLLGRLLVALVLCADGVTSAPALPLSVVLGERDEARAVALRRARLAGEHGAWLDFFLEAVTAAAERGLDTGRRLLARLEADRQALGASGRGASSALAAHAYLSTHPIASLRQLERALGLTFPTVSKAVDRMLERAILAERTGFARNRVFVYEPWLTLLDEGMSSSSVRTPDRPIG
jgi:Fic family protein